MRILIRTSKWAIWARRFGSLALPLAIVPVFMHRERIISSADFTTIEMIAMAVAGLAFVLAVGAFVRLWITGDLGWGKAAMGFFLSLLCLLPLGFVLYERARYPEISDLATDAASPPGLVSQVPPSNVVDSAAIVAAFPNARNRTYPIEAAQLYALVVELADQRGWEPRARREPQTPLAAGQVNSIAMTLIGYRSEVAIHIQGDAQGSTVSMRSASLNPGHDLGENGRRIEEFLTALDLRVTQIIRDAPVTGTPPADDPAPETPAADDKG
ncbi:MAG TPA: DUF1499 domain-containing protein [Devosia sp.]|nr:DUF1499 domain-containing protein [Devosia sp.]